MDSRIAFPNISFTILLLLAAHFHCFAQHTVKINLFYQEPQLQSVANQTEPDSIKIYVKEPFQEVREYGNRDLGYSTIFEIKVNEYCLAEICKNNKCLPVFLDSDHMEVMLDPQNFELSKTINSPLSIRWQSVLQEMLALTNKRLDSLSALTNQSTSFDAIAGMYNYYNAQAKVMVRRQISENGNNALGWNLFLRNNEDFEEIEIFQLAERFNHALSLPSTRRIQNRLIQYRGQPHRPEGIHDLFRLE